MNDADETTKDGKVSGPVFNLQALRVGQGVLGIIFVAFGAMTFREAASFRDLISFPLFGMGTLQLVFTASAWENKKWTLDCGLFVNTFGAMLGVLEMAFNAAATFESGKGAPGILLGYLLTIMSGGLGSSFNKLRKTASEGIRPD